MKDFIHGALVKAASSDGIETMLKGAGIGAGANVGIGAVQGDFDVIGNAFSGAALGGMGGAAMKYGANRYAGNLLKQADGITEAGGKKVGMFTNPGENHSLSFMGEDANTERFAKMAAAGEFNGKGYSAGAAAKEAAEVGDQVKKTPKAGANTSGSMTQQELSDSNKQTVSMMSKHHDGNQSKMQSVVQNQTAKKAAEKQKAQEDLISKRGVKFQEPQEYGASSVTGDTPNWQLREMFRQAKESYRVK